MNTIVLGKNNDSIAIYLILQYSKLLEQKQFQIEFDDASLPQVKTSSGQVFSGVLTVTRFVLHYAEELKELDQEQRVSNKNLLNRTQTPFEPYNILQYVSLARDLTLMENKPDLLDEVLSNQINTLLATNNYIVGHYISIADIFLYVYLHSIIRNFDETQRKKFRATCRWFDLVQFHEPWSDGVVGGFHYEQLKLDQVKFNWDAMQSKFNFTAVVPAPSPSQQANKDGKAKQDDKSKNADKSKNSDKSKNDDKSKQDDKAKKDGKSKKEGKKKSSKATANPPSEEQKSN